MLKVKMFIAKWLCKITGNKRWVHLYVKTLNEQIQRDIEEVYDELNNR